MLGQANLIHSLSSLSACFRGNMTCARDHLHGSVASLFNGVASKFNGVFLASVHVSSTNRTLITWSVVTLDATQNSVSCAVGGVRCTRTHFKQGVET